MTLHEEVNQLFEICVRKGVPKAMNEVEKIQNPSLKKLMNAIKCHMEKQKSDFGWQLEWNRQSSRDDRGEFS